MRPNSANDDRPLYALLGVDGPIGTALARRLAKKDVALLLGGHDRARTEGLARELGASAMEVDDRHLDQVRTFILAAADLPWKLAGIINCSESLLLRPQGAAPTGLRGEEDEDQLVAAHLAAAFATVRGAGEALKGGGRLILVTAVSPDPLPDRPAYRAAGSNLAALLRSAQDIYGPRGVRIEAVSPSANGTDIAHLIGASWVAEIVERLALPSATPTPEPVSAPEASPEHDPRVVDPAGDLEFEARSSRGSAWRV